MISYILKSLLGAKPMIFLPAPSIFHTSFIFFLLWSKPMIFLLIFLYHEFQIFTFAQPYDLFSFLYNSKQIKAFTLCQTMIFLSSFFINQYKFMIFLQFQLIINISYYTLCKDHHFFALSLTIYSNIKSTVLFYTMSNSHNFFAYSFVTKYYFKYKFNSNPIFFFHFSYTNSTISNLHFVKRLSFFCSFLNNPMQFQIYRLFRPHAFSS